MSCLGNWWKVQIKRLFILCARNSYNSWYSVPSRLPGFAISWYQGLSVLEKIGMKKYHQNYWNCAARNRPDIPHRRQQWFSSQQFLIRRLSKRNFRKWNLSARKAYSFLLIESDRFSVIEYFLVSFAAH